LLGLGISVTMAAIFITLRIPLARAFTGDEAVIAALDPFLLMLGIGLPLLVIHFTLAGALRGAGDTMTPLLAAAAGNWLFRVPLGYLFAAVWRMPLSWVWSIMIFDHLARCIWLALAFHGGRWQRTGLRPTQAAAAE
jgi:Na+-driven multidrug efflux pump